MTTHEHRGRAGITPAGQDYMHAETPEMVVYRMTHYEPEAERAEGRDNPFGRYWPVVKWATIGAVVFCALSYGGVLDWMTAWWMGRGG